MSYVQNQTTLVAAFGLVYPSSWSWPDAADMMCFFLPITYHHADAATLSAIAIAIAIIIQ